MGMDEGSKCSVDAPSLGPRKGSPDTGLAARLRLTVIRVDHVEARFVLGGESPTRLSHTQEALPGGSAESRQ
jgi:hypothetical protein